MDLYIKTQKYFISIVLIVLLTILIAHCGFKTPEAPTWETLINIPLISKQYTMAELAENEKNLFIDSTGVLSYHTKHKIPRFEIGDKLSLMENSKTRKLQIGNFHVPSPGSQVIKIHLSEVYDKAEVQHGQKLVVPYFTLIPVSKSYPEILAFRYLVIKQGVLTISVSNQLPVILGEPLFVTIKNADDHSVIGQAVFNEKIKPEQSVSQNIDLAGRILKNKLLIEISGSSSGTDGKPRLIDENSSFSITLYPSDLVVSDALSRIPTFDFHISDSLSYSDSLIVQYAMVKNGQIKYYLWNDFSVNVQVKIRFPNIIKHDGSNYSDTIDLVPNQDFRRTVFLEGYQFVSDFQKEIQVLKVIWSLKILSVDDIVAIRSSDFVMSRISFSQIIFSSLVGRLNHIPLRIGPISKELNLPSVLDSLQLAHALLELNLDHNLGFFINTDLGIKTFDNEGDTAFIPVHEKIFPISQPGQIERATIRIPNIAPLFKIFPTHIELGGRVLIGEKKHLSFISEFDYIEGEFEVKIPLVFSMASQRVESTIKEIVIDEEYRERIRDNVISGKISVSILNHLPVGASVELFISDDSSSVFNAPDIRLGPVVVIRGKIEYPFGKVIEPIKEQSEIELSEKDLQIFEKSPIFVGLFVKWPSSGGRFLSIYDEDFIEINAWCSFKVLVDNSNS